MRASTASKLDSILGTTLHRRRVAIFSNPDRMLNGSVWRTDDYWDADMLFSIEPTVMGDAIDVAIGEAISDFVATTTGVNNSPTKNTHSMTTIVQLTDGKIVVLGGLVQDTASSATDRQR